MNLNQFGIIGVSGNLQLGKAGPRLLNNSGAIEHKNAANNALVVARGADAVGATDFVTKQQVLTGSLNSRVVSLTFTNVGANNIGAALPAGATAVGCLINVSTAFDGTTPTLDVGIVATPGQLVPNTEIDLTTIEVYGGFVFKAYTPATQLIATIAIGGSPSVGACDIIVLFANA